MVVLIYKSNLYVIVNVLLCIQNISAQLTINVHVQYSIVVCRSCICSCENDWFLLIDWLMRLFGCFSLPHWSLAGCLLSALAVAPSQAHVRSVASWVELIWVALAHAARGSVRGTTEPHRTRPDRKRAALLLSFFNLPVASCYLLFILFGSTVILTGLFGFSTCTCSVWLDSHIQSALSLSHTPHTHMNHNSTYIINIYYGIILFYYWTYSREFSLLTFNQIQTQYCMCSAHLYYFP